MNTPISIHAPAKGATLLSGVAITTFCDFNPRSREGSDWLSGCDTTSCANFNPRSREGSDVLPGFPVHLSLLISIHAPAKGATVLRKKGWIHILISIHAPAKGATRWQKQLQLTHKFQSTLPRRERQVLDDMGITETNFNPRSREGSDQFFRHVTAV